MKEGHVFFLFFFVHRLVSRWHVISNPLISDVYLINLGRAQWMAHLCICSDITHPETHIQNAQHAGLHVHVDAHAHAHRFVCKSPQITVSTQAESSSFFFFFFFFLVYLNFLERISSVGTHFVKGSQRVHTCAERSNVSALYKLWHLAASDSGYETIMAEVPYFS